MKIDEPLFPPRVLYAWDIIRDAAIAFFPVWLVILAYLVVL